MLRSMDSAVAGLRAHQNKMDVIGHNLANVNTFGFKAQTYTFKEAMYQTSSASTGGTNDAGGSNAAQYGYGTLMGTIGVDMTASTPSYVGGMNATINGEGFFMTSTKKESTGVAINTDVKTSKVDWDYTRVGQFSIDSKGYVVDGNGNFVYGFYPGTTNFDATTGKLLANAKLQPLRIPTAVAENGGKYTCTFGTGDTDKALKATSVSINKLGEITATLTTDDDPPKTYAGVHVGTLALVTFQNPEGLTKSGQTYYKANEKDNTGRADATVPGGDGVASLMSGYIEASNVDLAKEFADMIMTQRGFQANSKMITVSDEMLSELVNMKR
ncbi:MAG: flagellar hook-basal body complex protein [Lachnospiraceae bacterium]|nr:flagellar hook-basal body complex protein [Lachnospiraceae bacterium]